MGKDIDMWPFKTAKELESNVADIPEIILNNQMELLGEKTDYLMYGWPMYIKVKSEEITYKTATVFYIVVPNLDEYKKSILILYSNPETDYPVAITCDSTYDEDCQYFRPEYICTNKEEFHSAIKTILSSESVLHTVGTLYAKAKILKR